MTPTKKTSATPAEEIRSVEAAPCANCGAPAVWRTTNPGANVTHYCQICAQKAYPEDRGELARIDAG